MAPDPVGHAGCLCNFCMHALRKPFAVGSWSGAGVWDSDVQLKTTLVVAQFVSYASFKLVGIKFC